MKVYGTPYGGNPRRVAIFLGEKGIEIPFENVDMMNGAHRQPEFLRKNPAGEIPVLELDDGTCLSESVTICRYLEELHPAPPLFGTDPLDRARVDMWQRRLEIKFYMPMRECFRHSMPMAAALEPVQIAEWADINRARALQGFRMLDAQLFENTFVTGERFTIADITGLFTVEFGAMAGVAIPEDCVHVARWYGEVSQRPSVVATRPPQQG